MRPTEDRICSGLIGTALLALVFLGCDSFFEFDLVVTDCVTGQPLQGVAASSHLDDGFGEEDYTGATDMDGKVFILLNEPDGATVTLTLAKVGYQGRRKQFRGEPAKPYTVCLQPAPP